MTPKLLRRYLPEPERILQQKGLGFLRHRLTAPGLWHFNRRSASGAMLWGLYCAFLPLPLQMLAAAVLALFFQVNLPLCMAVVWVSNPLTLVPMFYLAYLLGCLLLSQPLPDISAIHDLITYSREHIEGLFHVVNYTPTQATFRLAPLLVGTQVAGLLAGLLGYAGMRLYWRWHVVNAWQARAQIARKKSS